MPPQRASTRLLPARSISCDDGLGVEDRGLPEAGADDAARAFDEGVGVLLAHLDGGAGLQQAHLFDDVEDEEGHVVDAVAAVGAHAADVDLREVGVGAALGRRHADFGRRGLVVELDPEAVQQFLGLVAGERAVGQPFLVERLEVLVQLAGVEGVPRVEFGGHAQVDEPVVLQRLPEIAGRVGGDVGADVGDAFEFALAGRVGLLRGQFARLFRVAFGEADDGIRRDRHRLELLLFGVGVGIVEEIQRVEAGLDVGLEVQHPLVVDFVVQHGVAGGALLHKLGENPGFVGRVPFGRHLLEDEFAHRLALPEGDDRVGVALAALPG